MNDIDNTIERRLKTEYFRADHLGFGVSKQGVGLAERYVPRLAQIVAADRAGPSNPLLPDFRQSCPSGDLIHSA